MRQSGIKTSTLRRLFRPLQLIGLLSIVVTATVAPDFTPTRSLLPNALASNQKRRQERGREAPQDDDSIKLRTRLVSLNVTVSDRTGRMIEGLKKENFKIYDDKIEQPINCCSHEDAPISVRIIFDTSGSMSGEKIMLAKDAFAQFIQTSHDQDEYFLINLNSNPQLSIDSGHDGRAALDQFSNVYPRGNTALYDAVYLGIEKVSHGIYPKHAIILISDGEDNNSRCSFDNVRRGLQESDVTIYAIGIGVSYLPRKGSDALNGGIILDKLATVSGGKAFYPKSTDEMSEAFEQVALELRRRYSIGYLPSNFVAAGKWHRVKVAVTVPHDSSRLIVRSREGYYAVNNPDDHQRQGGNDIPVNPQHNSTISAVRRAGSNTCASGKAQGKDTR